MKRLLLGIAFYLVSFAVGHGQDITYDLLSYPDDQTGKTLSGQITTDGFIGTLSSTDVMSWSFSINGSGRIQSRYFPGASFLLVDATPTQLLMPIGSELSLYLENDSPSVWWSNGQSDATYYYALKTDPGQYLWYTATPQMGGTEPWVIAEVVPEPSTLALLGVSAFGLVAYGWACREAYASRGGMRRVRESGIVMVCLLAMASARSP